MTARPYIIHYDGKTGYTVAVLNLVANARGARVVRWEVFDTDEPDKGWVEGEVTS